MSSAPRNDPGFELRILRMNWADKNDVAGVEISQHPIPLRPESSRGHFTANVPAYPKVDGLRHGQLAVSTTNGQVPRIAHPEGAAVSMNAVRTSTGGRRWWIERGGWKKVEDGPVAPGYHDAPSCRHSGTVLLHVGDQRCRVHVEPPGFEPDEFEALLSDFQDECWQLVFNREGYTTAPTEGESAVPGEAFVKHAQRVIEAAKRILKNPHRELREVQRMQRASRVRPVPRTFKELAAKGWPKKVTGRSHRPDYDTPENQYVASIIERLLRAVHVQHRSGQARQNRLGQRISRMGRQIDRMQEGVTRVDPSRLRSFAEKQEKEAAQHRSRAETLFPVGPRPGRMRSWNNPPYEARVTFRVTTRPGTEYGNKLSFFAEVSAGTESVTDINNHLFRFACDFSDPHFFEQGGTYEAYLFFQVAESESRKGPLAKWRIRRISDVEIVRNKREMEAARLRPIAARLESQRRDNQTLKLRRRWEREEQQREKTSLQQRRRFYEQERDRWSERLEGLDRLRRNLAAVKRELESRGIRSSLHARYPGTMVFVQQPDYRAAHAAYQSLQGVSGFRRDLFDHLLSLDDLSILDLPAVYERWCLLQIVRVLEEEYGFHPVKEENRSFEPRPEWQQELVKTVCREGERAFSILFRSAQLRRRVKLTYQATLSNGRRPDFLLEVDGTAVRGNNEGQSLGTVRAVFDAKFKAYTTSSKQGARDSLTREVENLVCEKDYAERGMERENTVFVLHPTRGAVPTPSIFQRWAEHSYYGGEEVFDWQAAPPEHRQGGVLVRPQHPDDIKRLVYMVLSYPIEETNETDRGDPLPAQMAFCPVCGGSSISGEKKRAGKIGEKHWLTCKNDRCGHFFVLNYCGSCHNRLWKHGSYWTFHDTHPLSPYNIKCPSCGAYAPTQDEEEA